MSVKTSFRLPEFALQQLQDLAEQGHNGNKSAAVVAAIERAHAALFAESLGWVAVRIQDKVRCEHCHNPIESGQGFIRLQAGGGLAGGLRCSKCAR